MLSRIEIKGLGPHDDLVMELDPDGETRVSGKSQCGKSTIVEAIAFVLWGQRARTGRPFPTQLIRTGESSCEVRLWLASGTMLFRRLTRGRQHTRVRERNGEVQSYSREDDWREALGPLGDDTLRLILTPHAWQLEADSAGGGRDLRDALDALLPDADIHRIVGELMAAANHAFDADDDPVDNKTAEKLRRKQNAAVSDCEGSTRQAATHLSTTEANNPETPTATEVAEATEMLALRAAHEEWAGNRRNYERFADAMARIAEWKARREALGDRPDEATDDTAEIRAKLDELETELRDTEMRRDELTEQIAVARAEPPPVPSPPDELTAAATRTAEAVRDARRAVDAAPNTDACPTCGRPWEATEHATKHRAEAKERLEHAEEAAQEARTALDTWRASANEAHDDVLAEYRRGIRALEDDKDQVVGQIYATKTEIKNLTNSLRERPESPAERWDREIAKLGDCPSAPDEEVPDPGDEPPNPTGDAVRRARDVLRAADRAEGAQEHHDRLVAKAKADLDAARARQAAAVAEAKRLNALVDAVRAAPTIAVREQLGALGDIGPVTLRLDDKGGAEVLIDGLPWDQASDGRLIVADAWFRAGLRRAADLGWMLLPVDSIQSVGGQPLPPVEPPTLLLETTDGNFEVVVAGRRG